MAKLGAPLVGLFLVVGQPSRGERPRPPQGAASPGLLQRGNQDLSQEWPRLGCFGRAEISRQGLPQEEAVMQAMTNRASGRQRAPAGAVSISVQRRPHRRKFLRGETKVSPLVQQDRRPQGRQEGCHCRAHHRVTACPLCRRRPPFVRIGASLCSRSNGCCGIPFPPKHFGGRGPWPSI